MGPFFLIVYWNVLYELIFFRSVKYDAVFEINFEAIETFGLTGTKVSQTKSGVVRKETLVCYHLTDFISQNHDKFLCQTICLTEFQTNQSGATLGSHCLTKWPNLHCILACISVLLNDTQNDLFPKCVSAKILLFIFIWKS